MDGKIASGGEAWRVFKLMSDDLRDHLWWGDGDSEKTSVELYAYDRSSLMLRQVLARRSWLEEPVKAQFAMKLGEGIAGAAFQQRRIVPWKYEDERPSFIRPVPYPDGTGENMPHFAAMLAIPVYHTAKQDDPRPPPWATIGVVCFGSTSKASKVPVAHRNEELGRDDVVRLVEFRLRAQALVYKMLSLNAAKVAAG